MTNKENIEKLKSLKQHIPLSLREEYEDCIYDIKKELKILDTLRKNIYIYVSNIPSEKEEKQKEYFIKVIYLCYSRLYSCGYVDYETKEILKNFNKGDNDDN